MQLLSRRMAGAFLVAVGACTSNPGNDPGTSIDLSSCTAATTVPVSLGLGESRIIDVAAQANCVSLPATNSAQEYLVVAYSGNGESTTNGSATPYALQSQLATAAGMGQPGSALLATPAPHLSNAARFEQTLRASERELVSTQGRRAPALTSPPTAPPALGDKDSFNVCTTSACSSFNRVGATVKYSGAPGVIYLDDHQNTGAEQFTDVDLQQLGQMFDNYLYPTDTTAFGRESDINGDQHIAILITPGVNSLTPDCTNGRVIGYTYGADLLPFARGTNAREMFYAFATSAATTKCKAVTRASALVALPPTLIHELQHMISFNQHVLLRNGADQEVWMNEGLSHFAEELGWRTIPASQCASAPGGDCFSEFAGGNIGNAYSYLINTEGEYLIAPEAGDGTLPERGAAWLFIRWVADHYSADAVLGTEFTRGMEQSTVLGATRVSQLTGVDFPTLVGDWQMANWTDDLPGFPQAGLLNYSSWNFRHIFAANYPDIFGQIFPLVPDSSTGSFGHLGTLRGGSGRSVRYKLPAGSPGVTIRMAGSLGGTAIGAGSLPRLAIVRVQ